MFSLDEMIQATPAANLRHIVYSWAPTEPVISRRGGVRLCHPVLRCERQLGGPYLDEYCPSNGWGHETHHVYHTDSESALLLEGARPLTPALSGVSPSAGLPALRRRPLVSLTALSETSDGGIHALSYRPLGHFLFFPFPFLNTVKSSNFGPPGNFGLLFRKGLAIIKTRPTEKMNGIKVVDKLSMCKVGYVHFWHRIHRKKLRILQEIVPSFHQVQS